MYIIKRNGTSEPFHQEKIAKAIQKSFTHPLSADDKLVIDAITQEVAQFLTDNEAFRTVEHIQDKVERLSLIHISEPTRPY